MNLKWRVNLLDKGASIFEPHSHLAAFLMFDLLSGWLLRTSHVSYLFEMNSLSLCVCVWILRRSSSSTCNSWSRLVTCSFGCPVWNRSAIWNAKSELKWNSSLYLAPTQSNYFKRLVRIKNNFLIFRYLDVIPDHQYFSGWRIIKGTFSPNMISNYKSPRHAQLAFILRINSVVRIISNFLIININFGKIHLYIY